MQRRAFMQWMGASALMGMGGRVLAADTVLSPPTVPLDTGARGRVVVVGGGMAGATVAKFLRLWGGQGVQVTLVEKEARYTSNIMSNLVLSGAQSMDGLMFSYDALTKYYGVVRRQGEVTLVDPDRRQLRLASGEVLDYDRLVMAPGLDFDLTPGLTASQVETRFPHAWRAGAQTVLLRDQIRAMRSGGKVIVTIPPAPYRCPPGPYERACVIADWIKRNKRGSTNPQVIVLDANPRIMAEPDNFNRAFTQTHAGYVTYIPNAPVDHIDPASNKVYTAMGVFQGDVINPIPPQRAGGIAAQAGLLDQLGGRFAGVDVLSYESLVEPNIHVIGDASHTTQPKAGHIANAEAKVCADAIVRLLRGEKPDPAPVTNSSCYSPITATTASWLTAVFAYDPVSRTMKVVPGATGEAAAATQGNYEQMGKWFKTLMADSFA